MSQKLIEPKTTRTESDYESLKRMIAELESQKQALALNLSRVGLLREFERSGVTRAEPIGFTVGR